KATWFMDYGNAAFGGGRSDNSVYYVSPNFSGFQIGAGYSFNVNGTELPGGSNNTRVMDFGVRYAAGPLAVAAAYQQADFANPSTRPDGKNFQIAGSYDFGVVKAHLGFGYSKDVAAAGIKNKIYTTGVSAP